MTEASVVLGLVRTMRGKTCRLRSSRPATSRRAHVARRSERGRKARAACASQDAELSTARRVGGTLTPMTALAVTVDASGLLLPALGLHLDPVRDVPLAFASHAHGDHAGGAGAGTLLATRETIALLEARRGAKLAGARPLGFGESIDLALEGGAVARATLEPAGHVLGAAQLVVDHPRGRLVYTGDYRTGAGRTHAAGAPIACDELIIESTFALPIFRFPPRSEALDAVATWCRARLDAEETPVLLAYALGKAQELAAELTARGFAVVAHGAAYKMCEAYEALGVEVGVRAGGVSPYGEQPKKKRIEAVVIVPPGAEVRMLRARAEWRVAYVSGWALLDASVEQRRADAGFVFSDHADSDDLVATARTTGAKRVYATHGDARALAKLLAREGIDAVALEASPIDEAPS